jgi:hypothetical protein
VSDQTEAATKKLSEVAEDAAAQVKDQAEAVIATIASSEQLANAKKQARKVQKKAAKRGQELGEIAVKRGQELGEEAAVRGKAAAKVASKEAKKRGQAAIAGAPAVAASARKSAAKKGEQALDLARERGGELLLSALETDPGKKIAGTQAGTALKSKLTARKRRRRKIALLLAINAGGAVAFKQLRARKSGDAAASSYDVGVPASTPPTETVAPGSTGTAAGDPLKGLVEEVVTESPVVEEQTEAPATAATPDGELKTEDEAEKA